MGAPVQPMIGDIPVDLAMGEQHGAKVTVTKHPVEEGAKLTDHAQKENETFSLDCIITNLPLNATDRDARGNAERFATDSYIKKIQKKLYTMLDDRKVIRVVTDTRAYESVMLVGLDINVGAKTGEVLSFKATFEQVRIASSKTVRLAALPKKAKNPEKPNGKANQSKQVGATEKDAKRTTALKSLTNFANFTQPGSGVVK